MPNLKGKIAVVTGASRGAGRGIAIVLGDAGATVYVTGRSSKDATTNPETIDETAEMVSKRGGIGIPVRCDHTVDWEVESLFKRVEQEQNRLDILVNNVWGGYEQYDKTFDAPFWQQPLWRWDKMFTAGVRAHYTGSHFLVPLMMLQRQGLIINTTFWDQGKYLGSIPYDLAKTAINRMAHGMSLELTSYNIAVVALSPGWMRTEAILRAYKTDEQHWEAIDDLKTTESPEYIGRAVTALAADPKVMEKSGRTLTVGGLAQEYGFTDVDGRQPPTFTIPEDDLFD